MRTSYYFLFFTLFLCGQTLRAQEVSILVPRGERAFEAITWLPDGRIYTPDYIDGKLFRVHLDGTLDTALTDLVGPLGGTYDPAGNYYFSEFGRGQLHRLAPDGTDSILARDLGQPSGTYYDGDRQRILVSDYTFSRLLAVSLTDGSVEVLVDSSSVAPTGLNGPDAIVAASDGNGYLIANFNDSLFHRYDTLGQFSFFTALPTCANSGYLIPYREGYLSAGLGCHQIWFIDASGAATVWAGTGDQAFVNGSRLDTVSFSLPNGLALSPDGDTLLISENTTRGQIRMITGLNALTGLRATPRPGFPELRLFPQPAHGSFTTTFRLPEPTRLSASLVAANGQEVTTFATRQLAAGEQRLHWPLEEDLPAGLYFLRLTSADGRAAGIPVVVR